MAGCGAGAAGLTGTTAGCGAGAAAVVTKGGDRIISEVFIGISTPPASTGMGLTILGVGDRGILGFFELFFFNSTIMTATMTITTTTIKIISHVMFFFSGRGSIVRDNSTLRVPARS